MGWRAAAAALAFAGAATAAEPPLKAPNVVAVSPLVVTSGQPDAAALRGLKAAGFEAVIYLAPPNVHDAVDGEAKIVAAQGLVFVNVPIRFGAPAEADFKVVTGALQALAGRKVLVHCQVNLRASSMVFLHRAITLREDPATAYADVARVWSPDPVWKPYIQGLLRRHGINFEVL
jgi:protein tyrosine phosphatase (PTP) superfamily phosphohydrolase (DUF442 family)